MSAVPNTHEGRELRRLIPLNTLPENRLEQVCSEVKIEEAAKGTALFHQGEATHEFVYLLSGTISLQAGGVEMDSVVGGSDVARFALAHQNPRKVSAIAKTQVRYVRIKPELINQQREENPSSSAGYKVSDTTEESGGDWMSALLRSPIFLRLPPANLQAVLRNVEEIQVKAGDVICRQDDEGDYFYIIKHGQCSLTRKPTPTAREIRLASLKTCDTFGEDALISEKPRTVTITMDTDGQLLRLDKANFLKLVRDPIITRLSAKEAMAKVDGGGIWLDVRLPDQYQQSHPRGHSINAPFFSLRMMLPTLDREKHFVVVCEDGKLSEAAAYLLLRFRFNAYVLKGGIPSLPAEALISKISAISAPVSEEKPPESKAVFKPLEQPDRETEEPASPPADGPAAEPAAETDDKTGARRGEHDPRNLEARFGRLMSEKEKSDAELQQARHTIHKLEASLQALQREHERLMQDRAEDSRSEESADATEREALNRELEALKTRYSEAVFEKESAEQEIRNLEIQVGDLKAMMEEFLEQGDFALAEQAEALRAELDMVREQAGAELTTLQSLLSEAETENVRLRGELQSLKTQLSVRNIAASANVDESATAEQRSLVLQAGWALAAGLLLTALVLGGLFGLEPGRELARSWLGETAPAQPTQTPN